MTYAKRIAWFCTGVTILLVAQRVDSGRAPELSIILMIAYIVCLTTAIFATPFERFRVQRLGLPGAGGDANSSELPADPMRLSLALPLFLRLWLRGERVRLERVVPA
jgi:hypothetical protein